MWDETYVLSELPSEIETEEEAEFIRNVLNLGPGMMVLDLCCGQGRHIRALSHSGCRMVGLDSSRYLLEEAKKSVSAFKVRQGMTIGAMVTLRGQRMYDFVEKLIHVSFPRIRDFRGISEEQVDFGGNLTVGFREHLAFPEIKADEVDNVHGLEVTVVTTAKTQEEGLELLKLMGFPFKHEKNEKKRRDTNVTSS